MKFQSLLKIAGLAGALVACSPQAPSHDKAFYSANANERATQLAACKNDPGRLSTTPNCINAQAAESDALTAHFYDVPKPASRVAKPGGL